MSAESSAGDVHGNTLYGDHIKDRICEGLMQGNSLNSVCKQDGFPSESTVRRWVMMNVDPDFTAKYTQAREIQAERFADELIDIADGKDGLKLVQTRGHGEDTEIYLDAAATRLRLDARKWVISKILPKKYGEKLDHTNNGGSFDPVTVYLPSNGRDLPKSED
jgi:hypothetical protein